MIFRRARKNLSTQENSENKSEAMVVYLLAERLPHGVIGYADSNGLPIQAILTDIEEAKIAMLTETRITRLIIIESGMGRFASTNTRDELIDLIGMCDGEEKKVCIFYTNSSLKGDSNKILGRKSKEITWYPYKNTVNTIETVLKLQEKYIGTTAVDKDIDVNEALTFRGYRTESILDTLDTVYSLDEEIQNNESVEFMPKFKVAI